MEGQRLRGELWRVVSELDEEDALEDGTPELSVMIRLGIEEPAVESRDGSMTGRISQT